MPSNPTYRLWSDTPGSWYDHEVVGEYYHTDAIRQLFPSNWNRDGDELFRDVELVPEPDNPYGAGAISVRADGQVLGYLGHEDSPGWAGVIRRITASGLTAITSSRIYLYQRPDWDNVDAFDQTRTETRARISIKLGNPDDALPLNDPPAIAHTLIPRSTAVQVTKENEHFDTLFNYVPPCGHGPLYATLHEAAITTARTTKTIVEVRIDNQCVGQLTPQMSQRFLPMIQHLNARGLLAACHADITGSSVAAEVRIHAAKANEVDDTVLDGPAITHPALLPALDDPREYRIPDAYTGAPPAIDEQRPARPRGGANLAQTTVEQPGLSGDTRLPATLIVALVAAGLFAVLIPHIGPVVWLSCWGAVIYIIARWVRAKAVARGGRR